MAADPALTGLLDEVAADFRDHGYDLKYLIRALMATRAYNLSSAVDPAEPTAPPLFARMPVRGLSPGQFIDSLGQATGADIESIRGPFLALFADRNEAPTEAQTSILQALTLMNGGFVAAATDPRTGDLVGAVAEAPYLDTAGRVEVLYLATLTAAPPRASPPAWSPSSTATPTPPAAPAPSATPAGPCSTVLSSGSITDQGEMMPWIVQA